MIDKILSFMLACGGMGGLMESQEQSVLKLLEIGEPLLREPARPLLEEEILSSSIQELILAMQKAMREAPGVGLAAPQIGQPLQLIVIEDSAADHSQFLTPEQLAERERTDVPFHVVINPKIYIETEERVEFFEACLSIPEFRGLVPRALVVRVECLNERAEPVTIRARGWHARILQHEIDHLNGILYIDRANGRTLMTESNYQRLWKDKPIEEVRRFFSGS